MTLVTTPASPLADSYVDLAAFIAYCAAVGFDLADYGDPAKEVALRKATIYIDSVYRDVWIGYKFSKEQSLCWPRVAGKANNATSSGLYDPDGFAINFNEIPRAIVNSTCAAAVQSISGVDLLPTIDKGEVLEESVESGPLSSTTKYGAFNATAPRFLGIEGALKGYVKGGPGSASGRLVRG